MFYDILDEKRTGVLPLLKSFKEKFYLAGGTGLALQIGHRDSADFDFFTEDHFDTAKFYADFTEVFGGIKILKTLEEKDSLNIIAADEIKLSFLRYPYKLLNPRINEENLCMASIEDIACMKLSAIVSRAVEKDFVDLYFILQQIPLQKLLQLSGQKTPDLDINLVLKSLVYFDDVVEEKIMFKHAHPVSFNEIKHFLGEQVRALI